MSSLGDPARHGRRRFAEIIPDSATASASAVANTPEYPTRISTPIGAIDPSQYVDSPLSMSNSALAELHNAQQSTSGHAQGTSTTFAVEEQEEQDEDAQSASSAKSSSAAQTKPPAPATSVQKLRANARHRRNFSETEFMDSGMGRSHTSELPFLGLQNELDDSQMDEFFTEEFLLSKLQDAQRRLGEIRDYKCRLIDNMRNRNQDVNQVLLEQVGDSGSEDATERESSLCVSPQLSRQSSTARRARRDERLFVASFRLPLKLDIAADGTVTSSLNTGGLGLVSAFRELLGRFPIRWLGAPGQLFYDADQFSAEERESVEKYLTSQKGGSGRHPMGLLTYVPIFPDAVDAADHQEFCNSVLWQLFHYLPLSFEGERVYQPDMFDAYARVNLAYADALIKEWQDSGISESEAMFWIHDIHLLLVPKLLRERMPNARIGFFLHTPFPAGEVYRTLPCRKELLDGMLGSDLLGFHTYDYARHFLSACERLLGLTIRPDAVDNGGVCVQVGIYPFGIDTESFSNAIQRSSVREIRDNLRDSLSGTKILLGVDRLDYIKGIPNKLLAFEYFLETHPEWRGRVVLLQVATPSRTSSDEYETFRAEVLEMVGRINGRFGTLEDMPINYREHMLNFEELCGLYAVADVAILTSLRDGMNLVSYEYIMCQHEHHGALILSEFTGAAQNLPGAILCNPWNIEEVSNAIFDALEMSDVERELKHRKLYRHVRLNTSAAWGVRFTDDLIKYSAVREEIVGKLILLPVEKAIETHKAARRRLFLLDYDGTLRRYETQPELAEPSESLKNMLAALASDPSNIVFIITGRQKNTMMEWFGGKGIGFAVEHGFALRWPDHMCDIGDDIRSIGGSSPADSRDNPGEHSVSAAQTEQGYVAATATHENVPHASSAVDAPSVLDKSLHSTTMVSSSAISQQSFGDMRSLSTDGWYPMLGEEDFEAMRTTLHTAEALLRRIEAHLPASFISKKRSALTWHFRDADPDFAFSAAQDARQALHDILFGSPMEVLMGSEAIHVRPRGVHKGAAVAEIFRRLDQSGLTPDWVLSIGDDRTDEDMFEQVHTRAQQDAEASPSRSMTVTTVTVGRKTTRALFFVPSVHDVVDLLTRCAGVMESEEMSDSADGTNA